MVAGMSMKSGEPRGGNSSHRKQEPQHSKTKPPIEAMQMARMLEDSRYPADISDKLKQVQAIVPHRSEEEICIALHDSDFDPEKAISTLLDNETQSSAGEWTTTGGRKGKKKSVQNDGIDLIVAPGDTKTQGKRRGGTNKAAINRDSFGGGVVVGERGRGRTSSGRGRSTSGPRREGGKRKPPNTTLSDRRSRTTRERPPRSTKLSPPPTQSSEVWDTLPLENDRDCEVKGQDNEWPSAWDQPDKTVQYWDSVDEGPHVSATEQQPVFPEAIPTTQALSTPAEVTPTLAIADRDSGHPHTTREEDCREKARKPRRIARSQIPTQPVEMPGGESLDLRFGSLGIDFGGSETEPVNPNSFDSIITFSDMQHRLTDDPGVISVGSPTAPNYRLSGQPETPTTLDGPPGLTHPSSHDRSLEAHDQRLSSADRSMESHDLGVESHDQHLPLTEASPVESVPIDHLSPGKESTLPSSNEVPEPIELPPQQKTTTATSSGYTVSAGSELLMTHTSTTSVHTSTPSIPHTTVASGKPVPPGMLYPHMVPQYPAAFMPMYPAAAAAANYGDPGDLSRYQASVSLAAYYTAAGDPSLSAAGGSREHFSTGGDKFGRGGAEVSATVSQSTASQGGALAGSGGMQPAFMNYPNMYPSNMFYPAMFYPPTHSMTPKPTSGGTTFPGGTNYQGTVQGANYNYDDITSEYSKMYSSSGVGSKSSNLPKSTATGDMSLGSYKQPHFDKQTNSSYQGFGMQNQQYMAGYMQVPPMAMPHIPLMADSTGSGRAGGKHSSKAGSGYQNSNYWSAQSS